MDNANALMLAVFTLAVAAGAACPKTWWVVVIPTLVPLVVTASPILRDPKSGDAFLFVAPFLIAIAGTYGVISFAGVALGRSLRQRRAKQREAAEREIQDSPKASKND